MSFAVVLFTWVPLMILASVEGALRGKAPLLFTDASLHARFLIAIPAFFIAEKSLAFRTSGCIDRLFADRMLGAADERASRLAASTTRWRDALAPELVLLALAVLGSQAMIRESGSAFGIVAGRSVADAWAPLKSWYAFVSLPVYQFLVYRWLWRWALWTGLLWGIAKLPPRPLPTHPDRLGGLGFLSEPSAGFGYVVFGLGCVHAGAWANQILYDGAQVSAFRFQLAMFLAVSFLVALGPLVFFSRVLWRARFDALREYDRLALDYGRLFHSRWIVGEERAGLLGAPDIQSLADIGTAYQVIREMRVVPCKRHTLFVIAAAVLVPVVPLLLLQFPLGTLVRKLAAVALGGLPG